MQHTILHISDLHFTKEKNDNDEPIKSIINDYKNYLDIFIDKIEELNKKNNINNIIITGDLTDNGDAEEYIRVDLFLNNLCKKINFKKDNIIIVPGNHDINWKNNLNAFDNGKTNNPSIKPYEYHKEKFRDFTKFYNNFYQKKSIVFNPSNSIVRTYINKTNKLTILGINSCFKESYVKGDHYGYVDDQSLKNELNKLNIKNNAYNNIAIFHHFCEGFGDNSNISIKNWREVQDILNSFNILTYIFGHEHTDGSEGHYYNVIGVGAFSKTEKNNFFNIYTLNNCENSEVNLKVEKYKFEFDIKEKYKNTGYWNFISGDKSKKEFKIVRERGETTIPDKKKTTNLPNKKTKQPQNIIEVSSDYQSDDSKKLFQIVKEKKYFKSGHFHWGKNSRAHNWIDTISLLSKHKYLKFAKATLIRLIEEKKIECDIIIGLGMEGNLLGNYLALKFQKDYTYLPYANRWNEHRVQETDISLKNKHKILLINDVTNKASSIKELIDKKIKILDNATEINLVCLFYTGKEKYKIDIFNSPDYKKINFYCVCDIIKVEPCHYQDNSYKECLINKHNLDTIFKFYNGEESEV